MIKAKEEDKSLVIALLERSFKKNQSVNFIIRGKNKQKGIRDLMDYSFEVCRLFGEVWLSDNKEACALLLFPDRKRATLKSTWLDMKLIFGAIGLSGIFKTLNRETEIKKRRPKRKMAYLWFIGVDPVHQHKGTGSRLLAEILSAANNDRLPVYLETSTLKNLPWYDRFGFEIYNQLELGYTLFFLKHEPIP